MTFKQGPMQLFAKPKRKWWNPLTWFNRKWVEIPGVTSFRPITDQPIIDELQYLDDEFRIPREGRWPDDKGVDS